MINQFRSFTKQFTTFLSLQVSDRNVLEISPTLKQNRVIIRIILNFHM
jgi:hypothetical protein